MSLVMITNHSCYLLVKAQLQQVLLMFFIHFTSMQPVPSVNRNEDSAVNVGLRGFSRQACNMFSFHVANWSGVR